jgi:tryptophan halogenase
MVQKVIVLGGGSAGFMAAMALKTKLPTLEVELIRSKDIGIIGVGEGSTVGLTNFLHQYLRIGQKRFFEVAQPVWKLGLRFIWGPRRHFFYPFKLDIHRHASGLPKVDAYYCHEDMEYCDRLTAMMTHDRVFERGPGGAPALHGSLSYHFENEKFVRYLEGYSADLGVTITDDTVLEVKQDENGITGLLLKSGREAQADLYVDSSGFAAVLLSKTLKEPFISYKSSLFCDRAVVGGWDRSDEPIKPYTTCETMNSGWCWQIEHETRINRGYVFSSDFLSDSDAEAEFRAANPKVGPTRIVKFVSGRYERAWVKNVVGIGNASGFVEPLEATALGVIGLYSSFLADMLVDSDREIRPSQVAMFNRYHAGYWDGIRNFLAIHYRFNTRSQTPFWEHCRQDTDLAGATPIVEYYRANGPSVLWNDATLLGLQDQFGLRGYYVLLIGQQVPYRRTYVPSEAELTKWNQAREQHHAAALRAITVNETLAVIRSPQWRWVNP